MANLRTKYRNHNNQLVDLDLSVGAVNPIKDVSGSFGNSALELRIIPYNEYARTQDMLNIVADLIANDIALNAQTSSTTFLLSEGVFTSGNKFEKTELDEYRFTLKGGSLKVGDGVYTVTQEEELSLIKSLSHPNYNADAIHIDDIVLNNYYRMDYLLFNFNPSSAIEYVEGVETSFIPPIATQLERNKSNINGSSAYVLYSLLLRKRNFYIDIIKTESLTSFRNVFEEDTIQDVALFGNEIYVLRINTLGKIKLYKYNTFGIAVGFGSSATLDANTFANAKMIVDADGVWIQARWTDSTSTFGRAIIKFTLALAYDGHKDEDDTDSATVIPTATGYQLSQSARGKTLASNATHLFVATKAIDVSLKDSIGISSIPKSNWTAGSYTNATPPTYAVITYAADVVDNFAFFDGDTTSGEKYAYVITSKDIDKIIHFRKVKLSDLSVTSGPDKTIPVADTISFKNFAAVYYESGSTKELRYTFIYKTIGFAKRRVAIGKIGIDFPVPVTNPDVVTVDTVDFTGSEMLSPSIVVNSGSSIVSTLIENTIGIDNVSQDFSNTPDPIQSLDTGIAGTVKGVSFEYDLDTDSGYTAYAREDAPVNEIILNRIDSVTNTFDTTKLLSLAGTVQFSYPKIAVNSANVYVAFSVVDQQVTLLNILSGVMTATPTVGASSIVIVRLDKSLNIVEYKILYYATKAIDNIAYRLDDRFMVVAGADSLAPTIEMTKLRLDLSLAPLSTFIEVPSVIVTDRMRLEFNKDFIYLGYLDGTSAKIVRMNIILANVLSNITLSGNTAYLENISTYFNEVFVATVDTTNNVKIHRLPQTLSSEAQIVTAQASMERASMFIRNRFIYIQSVNAAAPNQIFNKYDLSFNKQIEIVATPVIDASFADSDVDFKANNDISQVIGFNLADIEGYPLAFNVLTKSKMTYLVKPEPTGGVFFIKEISPFGKTYEQKNPFIVADADNLYVVMRDYNYSEGNKSELVYKYALEKRGFETVIDNITQVWKYTGLVNTVKYLKGYMKLVSRPSLGLTESLFELKTARYEHLCDKDGNLLDWLDAQSAGGTSTVGAKFDATDGNHAVIPLLDSDPDLNGFDSLLSADYLGGSFINDFSVIPFSLNAISNLASIGINNVTMRRVQVQILGVPGSPYQEGMAAAFFEYPEFQFLSGDIIYDGTATLGILGAELELPGDMTGTNALNNNTTAMLLPGDFVSVYEGSGKYQTASIQAISYDSINDKTIIQLSGLTKKIGNVESNPGSSKLKFFKNSPTQIGLENFIDVTAMQNQLDSQAGTYRTVEINFPTSGIGAAVLDTRKYYFLKLRAYDTILNYPVDAPPRLRVVNPVADIAVTNRSSFFTLSYVQPPGSYPTKVQLFDDFEDLTVANSDRLAETGLDDYFISSRALDDSSLRELDTNDMSDNQCFFDVRTGRVLFKPGFQPLNTYADYYALNVVNGNITADDIKVINIPGVDEVTLADKLIAGNI